MGCLLLLNKLFPVLNLRLLIVLLAFSAALATLISSFHSTYQVQKEQLISHTLKSNFAYANKLASATDNFLESAKQQLAYSANKIEQNINNAALLQEEVTRLNLQTNSFNSVVISKNGVINATSPYLPEIIGKSISSPGATQALKEKKPLISMPYMSAANNLIIFISIPIP